MVRLRWAQAGLAMGLAALMVATPDVCLWAVEQSRQSLGRRWQLGAVAAGFAGRWQLWAVAVGFLAWAVLWTAVYRRVQQRSATAAWSAECFTWTVLLTTAFGSVAYWAFLLICAWGRSSTFQVKDWLLPFFVVAWGTLFAASLIFARNMPSVAAAAFSALAILYHVVFVLYLCSSL